MGIEIERKFTIKKLPENLEQYPVHVIEQGYLNVAPAIRVRRQDDSYYMTYKRRKDFGKIDEADIVKKKDCCEQAEKGETLPVQASTAHTEIGQTEYNMPLDKTSYEHLVEKADGNVIRKKRYLIPLNSNGFDDEFLENNKEVKDALATNKIKIELDVFGPPFEGRLLAEVEFPSEEAAAAYHPAEWFDEDVTGDLKYSNAHMSAEIL